MERRFIAFNKDLLEDNESLKVGDRAVVNNRTLDPSFVGLTGTVVGIRMGNLIELKLDNPLREFTTITLFDYKFDKI